VLAGRAHRELVHIGFADHDSQVCIQFFNDGRLVRRHKVAEYPAGARRGHVPGAHVVLHRHGHAGELREGLALLLQIVNGGLHGGGAFQRLPGVVVQQRVHAALHLADAVQRGLCRFHGRCFARFDLFRQLIGG
jgi:hypothetical protein